MSVTYGGIKMAWAKNGTPDTLTGTNAGVTISDLTSTIFNVNLSHVIKSTSTNARIRFGSSSIDTGSNYASRESNDGGTDTVRTSQTNIIAQVNNLDFFHVFYAVNISAEEKLIIIHMAENVVAGAGTAPSRAEVVAKWVNTSNQYDNVQVYPTSGLYAIGSNISALGTD